MKNSEKLLELISGFIKNGILTSEDVKKEILTNLKFKKDSLVDKLQLVTREEFEILKFQTPLRQNLEEIRENRGRTKLK